MTAPTADIIFPKSIWAETAPRRLVRPPLRQAVEADTVIIGGGLSGLSAALHLAKSGQKVVLLEAMAVGWGASGRNNGQVIPTMTAAEPDVTTPPVADWLRATILPGRQAVSDTRGDLRFFRYDARNRLITGGVVIGAHNNARRVAEKASGNLAEAFPALGKIDMTHVWSGYIGMTWDRFPRVHNLGPDAWAWIGCNGRGVALAVSLGREMARAVSGEPISTLALPVSEPRPLPFHTIARRVAPSYLAWLRRKDRIEMKP